MRASRADAVLAALDPEQREVAASPLGPMCVLAGAGTGKTRAITHRIAYGVHSGAFQPQRVLAVTFTARAAGEMRTRLRTLGVGGVQARTFHAAALRQLHYFWPQAVGGAAPEVLPTKAAVLGEAAARLRMQFDRTALRDLASEIEWAKVSLLTPETYAGAAPAALRDPAGIDPTAMARLWEAYEQRKGERGVIDFEDVLLLTAGILDDRPDIARTVREQYRHFVVDEYQDVNALQQRLLDLWLGGREDVCVVGDPAQTIYSFTGASPEYLLSFPRRYPAARVVRLVRNYRSTRQIVGLANLTLRSAPLAPAGPVGREAHVVLQAQAGNGPQPTLRAHADDPAEADAVASEIKALLGRGHPAAQIAVLFRVNAQSEALEAALAALDIPYLVRGGERFFARQEVRAATVLLRGAVRGDDGATPLPDLVRDVLGGAGWSPKPPSSGGALRERWESLNALVTLADELVEAVPAARMRDLVRRAGAARGRAARPCGGRRDPRLAARRQGPGVGRRLPRRSERRADPHHHGRGPGGGRGGAAAALRRAHPGTAGAAPVVCRRPQPRGQGDPPAVALPRRRRVRAGAGRPVPAGPPHEAGPVPRPGGRRRYAGRAANPWAPPPRARWAGARAARRPMTRPCSRRCAPGASRSPTPCRYRHTSSSPTRR